MKDAIIKEIRKTDDKGDKTGLDDAAKKKKRNRINKERVDINNPGAVSASVNAGAARNENPVRTMLPVKVEESTTRTVSRNRW